MKLVEWLKWKIAPAEMAALEQWEIQWQEHRRWFAEFPVAALVLDRMKAKVVFGAPLNSIQDARDSCRNLKDPQCK